MRTEPSRRPQLRLLRGGKDYSRRIGSIKITVSPRYDSPFPVDAVVNEEDTFLVLSAGPLVRHPGESPSQIIDEMLKAQPVPPGDVVVKPGMPLKILAVIYDFDVDPPWKWSWIAAAMCRVFEEARQRRLTALAFPMLGPAHTLEHRRLFLEHLVSLLSQDSNPSLRRLWLVLPERLRTEALAYFDSLES